MMMSASLSLKMMRRTIAVIETGSISGKVTCQKRCQGEAPSTRRRLHHLLGHGLQPRQQQDHDERDDTQASIASIASRASQGSAKNEGCSQPSQRARRATGPKRYSSIDLPTIQLTATGESISGMQEGDAPELPRPDVGVEQQREAEGDGVLDEDAEHVDQTMLRSAFQ